MHASYTESMHRRLLLGATASLVVTCAIIACSDDSTDMEYQPGAATYPQEDTGTGTTSSGDLPKLGDSGLQPSGDDDDGGDAATDAGATDAGDATTDDAASDASAEADAPYDAGNDPTLGAVPLSLAFAGLGLGADTRALTAANFAGNNLDAWTAGAEHFDRGTTTVTAGAAAPKVGWGQWSAGIATDGTTSYTWPANGGAVYVIAPSHTGAFPNAGAIVPLTAAGATGAVTANGSVAPGTAAGGAALYEGATSPQLGITTTFTIGADSYNVSSTGGAIAPATSELTVAADGTFAHTFTIASTSTFCGGSCLAAVKGFVGDGDVAVVVHIYKNTSGEAGSLSGGLAFSY